VNDAKLIMRRFIGQKSRTPVNISGPVLDEIVKEAEDGNFNHNMFDTAYQQILRLLMDDSYRRFVKQRQGTLADSESPIALQYV
jgi:hypothetical protein